MIPEGERQVSVSKVIGMPELEDGGKLHPLQRPGRSGILPEEDPKLPRIEDYSGEADLPTDGLIVSPAWMAEAVLGGRKTLIVKTRPFEIAGKRYLLISERKALGVVTLGKLRDVDLDELKRIADQHLISDDVRSDWAKTQKSWKKGPFYAWPVAVESKFDEPVETNIGPGPQVLARDVELKSVEKQIRTDPSHIFFCARLPENTRKKLSELSVELLKENDSAEVEDVDHITVLYVPGRGGEYSESDKEDVLSAIKKVLDSAKPIDAKFQGWGYFDGASKGGEAATALVALVDAPGLAELHTEIKAAMSKAGFTEVDDQTHGFVPHATLAYLPVGARIEKLPVLDAAFKIEKIELVHSDISEMDLRGAAKRLSKPFRSPGGKDAWVGILSAKMPAHKVYVEPYAGSASLFFAKDKSDTEVLADTNKEIMAVFRFLQIGSDDDFKWIRNRKWKWSKEHFVQVLKAKPTSLRELAYRYKYLNLFSIRGANEQIEDSDLNRAKTGRIFLSNLEKFRDRLKGVKLLEQDAFAVMARYDGPNTFYYLDPPWKVLASNKEWKDFDQKKFVEACRKLKGKALISYQGKLDLPGWSQQTKTVTQGGIAGDSKQNLYWNYSKTAEKVLKRVKLVPDLDVEALSTAELTEAHWRLHMLFRGPAEDRRRAGFSAEDVSNLHALIVDELFERKVPHPPPPGDGLDDVSEDFERHEERQPDYDVPPWEKMSKRDYAPINASGVERGKEITLDEVLPHFKTFKTKKPYVYLVGGLANRGKTKGDIDILVKDTEDLPEDFKHVVHFRLGRMLPPEMAERLEIHYDNFHGPFTRFVELFDLTFERVNPENEVKLMRDETTEKQEARAASPALRTQAERAEKNDKLTLGEFFYQPKPTRPAFPEELQTIERFLSLYRERAETWLPTVVQKKMDGSRHQAHKDVDTVKIFSEDGEDNTARLPQTVEEIRKLKIDKLVFDCEIELWKGRQHLPREAIAGYLHSKDEPDDSDVVTNMFDVLYHGKEGDIHKEPVSRRLELLEKVGIEQSTMGAPDLKHRLNAAPGDVADDPEALEKAVRRIRELPGSEGVVCKQVDSPYPLKVVTPDSWVKFHNASTVRGIVLGREKTKGNVWVYQYGVLPGKAKPIKTVQVKGKTVTPVGDTFATKLDFAEGDPILIEGETINIERSPKGERMSVWVPRVIGPWTDKADTTDSAAARARRNLVLQVKVIDEKGEIEYLPTRAVEKQADPYMEYPDEDKAPYRYAVQHHHRGKGLHADLRIGYKPGKLLFGWTMNTQIAGAIKDPVTTLAEARRLARESMDRISKINWNTGKWAERPKRGTTKLVRTSILSERKAPEPWAWLDVEGKTKDPEPGKPPPVGGTKNFPGVFAIVDEGEVEIGSNKPWFHEYFVTKGALKGRLIFRQLKIQPAKKGAHSRTQCMHKDCKSAPEVDVLWADGRGRAWFCKEHLAEWKQQFEDQGKGLGIVDEKTITSGEVPEQWSAVHKSEDVIVGKEIVLPPSEEQGLPGPGWLSIKPDDLTPYVLDSATVKKDWMPPVGISALPRAIRAQIPKEYRYWKKKTTAKAKQARDALFLAIKAKDVKIDYSAPYGRTTTKASMLDASFVLQEQTWRGPIQIRVGPSRTLWHLRLDVGRPELIVAEMYLNPLDNKRLAADVKDDPHKESMKLQGAIKPSHYLNPTKATPSNIEILDSGKASVLAYSDKFLKVQLKGELLKGLYEAKRSDGDWLWQPSEPGPKVEKEAGDMADEYKAEFVSEAVIAKVDKEKRVVTGVVLEPDEVDAQGDTIDIEAIERAAYKFLAQYNRETKLGVLHTIFGENGIDLVESWTAKTDFKLGDESISKGTWLMSVKVLDDVLWKKVKKGEITGFSIGGVATVI